MGKDRYSPNCRHCGRPVAPEKVPTAPEFIRLLRPFFCSPACRVGYEQRERGSWMRASLISLAEECTREPDGLAHSDGGSVKVFDGEEHVDAEEWRIVPTIPHPEEGVESRYTCAPGPSEGLTEEFAKELARGRNRMGEPAPAVTWHAEPVRDDADTTHE